jgi:hypothetical protein
MVLGVVDADVVVMAVVLMDFVGFIGRVGAVIRKVDTATRWSE